MAGKAAGGAALASGAGATTAAVAFGVATVATVVVCGLVYACTDDGKPITDPNDPNYIYPMPAGQSADADRNGLVSGQGCAPNSQYSTSSIN